MRSSRAYNSGMHAADGLRPRLIPTVRQQGNLMTDAPTIRAFSANEWRVYRDLRLRALADSPDAFGSTLAAETGGLDAEWARHLASSVDSPLNLPLVAEVRGEPIGLAWGRIDTSDPDLAALYQMWVAPSHRGVGARSLSTRMRQSGLEFSEQAPPPRARCAWED